MNSWPLVPLGEVLTERQEIPHEYDLLSGKVRIVAKIGFQDGKVELRSDGETRTKMILIRPGDLVVSGINAAKGAIAIYGKQNTEPIAATIHYGSYIPNEEKAEISYLWWLLRSGAFREILAEYLPGGIKTELKAKRLLPIPVPLPPLAEQRRIVALAGKIAEARGLRQQAVEECENLLRSFLFHEDSFSTQPTFMKELLSQREPDVDVLPNEFYSFAGVYCFGKGVFKGNTKSGMDFAYKKLTRLRTNDFVYPKLMAWEGAFGIVPPECEGLVVSTEFSVFKIIDHAMLLPETLDTFFRTPSVWPQMAGISTGTNVRRRRLNPKSLLEFKFPLPPFDVQMLLQKTKKKVAALKRLQAGTQRELEALLPSVLEKAFRGEL